MGGVFAVSGGRVWRVMILEGTSRLIMERYSKQCNQILPQVVQSIAHCYIISKDELGRNFSTRFGD